jgi:hypothetical protein
MFEYEVLKLTFTAGIADRAFQGVMDQQEFEIIPSHPEELFGVGGN